MNRTFTTSHKSSQNDTYPFMSILILKFDQPQSFEKKPYENYYFLVSYACTELFL